MDGPDRAPAAGDPMRFPTTRRFATRAGTIVADVYGTTGEWVVLLHGIPGDRRSWGRVATLLAGHARVFVPDLLGFGESADAPPAIHAAGHAEIICELLDRIGADTAHFVGFDFGGPVAINVVRRAPDRVRSLTVVAANIFPDTPVPAPLRLAAVPGLGAVAFRIMFGRLGLAMMWLTGTGDREAYRFRTFGRLLRSRRTVRSTRRIFYGSMRDLPGLYTDVERTARDLRVPGVAVWGDRDPFLPTVVGERTARALGGGSVVLLPGCGHFVPEERPRELAARIGALIGSRHGTSDMRR